MTDPFDAVEAQSLIEPGCFCDYDESCRLCGEDEFDPNMQGD